MSHLDPHAPLDGGRPARPEASAWGRSPKQPADATRTAQWRRDRLQRSRLYLCTDARLGSGDFADFVDAAYRGGVDIVQLRDKHLDAGDLLEYLDVLAEAARRHGGLFAVNDRADVAALSDADILHVGQRDLSTADARRIVSQDTLIGRSTHSRVQAEYARLGPDDYYCIGPVWKTPTKPGRAPVGVESVSQVAAQASLAQRGSAAQRESAETPAKPWFAIGGINADTVDAVVGAGASRIVVVRAITQADDPEEAARTLIEHLPPLSVTALPQ